MEPPKKERKLAAAAIQLMIGHLLHMIHSKTKDECEDTLHTAELLLQPQPIRNWQPNSGLLELAALREHYSQYCLD